MSREMLLDKHVKAVSYGVSIDNPMEGLVGRQSYAMERGFENCSNNKIMEPVIPLDLADL
jgi:hypothetical protein